MDERAQEVSDYQAWLRAARGYIYAAEAVRRSRDLDSEMFAPALYLVGHSVELLLKANLLAQGASVEELKRFKHGLVQLWNDARNESLRLEIRDYRKRSLRRCEVI